MTSPDAHVVRAEGLPKRFGGFTAVDDVSFAVEANKIYGLLGRNGAGKTTLMQLLTGQQFPTSGRLTVFGDAPAENARVLGRICFIKESQQYPDGFKIKHVLRSAPWFFENWDAAFAAALVEAFGLPVDRTIKKLSRGQLSAIGVTVGLASRAPLTFFDEPYLGLDAVARQIFYDSLREDYSKHPRTVILSTHLIDEVSNLLQHVFVIDKGRILVDQNAEELRGTASTIVGRSAEVDAFIVGRPAGGREVTHREDLGGLSSVTVRGLTEQERQDAARAGLELAPVSLQQLIVDKTNGPRADAVTGRAR